MILFHPAGLTTVNLAIAHLKAAKRWAQAGETDLARASIRRATVCLETAARELEPKTLLEVFSRLEDADASC